MTEPIGPGWTLIQYGGDAEASIWRVQHDGIITGTVSRSYDLSTNARGWEARTANFDLIPSIGKLAASRRCNRLWRTRNAAAASIATYAPSMTSN